MNKDIKEQWVEALRSGEYEQGRGTLCQDNKFCCLGVLFDIAGGEVEGEWIPHDILSNAWRATSPSNSTLYGLPTDFLDFCEVASSEAFNLICMNDNNEQSFEQIAEWIEENL